VSDTPSDEGASELMDRGDPFGIDPPTRWPEEVVLAVADIQRAFTVSATFTVGVEEELMLLDPTTLKPAPANELLLGQLHGDDRFSLELIASQIEIVTPVLASADMVTVELARCRRRLADAAAGAGGVQIAAAGVNPTADTSWEVTQKQRYLAHEREYRWVVTECAHTFGLHVHVAIPGPERALAVFNGLRSFIPEVAALAANAPFYRGRDTGLCTVRPKLTEAFGRSGVPPILRSWEDFSTILEWGRRSGSFPNPTHLWWDIRPNTTYGTLEMRIADSQTRPEHAAAITAVVQCLCVWLAARYDAGERLASHPSDRISENRWRAIRHGLRGWMADLETGEPEPTRQRLLRLIDELSDIAQQVDASGALAQARTLIAGNGAERQRTVTATGGLESLLPWLIRETNS
jgi:carboxylate-amine ligase